MCSKKWIFLTKVSSQRGRYHEKANVSKTKPDNFVSLKKSSLKAIIRKAFLVSFDKVITPECALLIRVAFWTEFPYLPVFTVHKIWYTAFLPGLHFPTSKAEPDTLCSKPLQTSCFLMIVLWYSFWKDSSGQWHYISAMQHSDSSQ